MTGFDERLIWMYGVIVMIFFGGKFIGLIIRSKMYSLAMFLIPFAVLYVLYFTPLSSISVWIRLLIFGLFFVIVSVMFYFIEVR
ncbi:hypothetical protein CN984_03245 [Bacillus cereus]|uniref:Uncharacterized protein n=2 Tax=Bacillus cereus TaxID=1396 RepID=A0A2B9QHP4_BACCE|nr:hypothetical protein IGC_04383 [Bacillus cereus HuA4-10]PGO34294.1 hypothetical protein CN984_03245 [Bacillus cereus]QWI48439.1 hypothetical protein EXW56_05685 [Bacillus mycoides]